MQSHHQLRVSICTYVVSHFLPCMQSHHARYFTLRCSAFCCNAITSHGLHHLFHDALAPHITVFAMQSEMLHKACTDFPPLIFNFPLPTSPAVLPPPSLAPLELPVPTLFHLASPTERAPGAWRLAAPGGTVRGQRCRCTCGRPFITSNAEVVAVARVSAAEST